jgi:uncharacterized protein YbjT (DUF2867 family)
MALRRAIIFGATGTQGRAALNALLAEGWAVTAVTRSPSGLAAQALLAKGASLSAHADDADRLASLLDGAELVVSIQAALGDRWNSLEAIEGMRIATAAKRAGVNHFIQHSAIVDEARGVLGMGSKRAIEERIAELGLPATSLRPAFFMENLMTYFPPKQTADGLVLAVPLHPERPTEIVAAADIGGAVAAVARDPGRHLGQSYDLIAESLSLNAMAAIIAKAMSVSVQPLAVPPDALSQDWPQGAPLFRWIVDHGTRGDASHLPSLVGSPLQLQEWASTTLVPTLPSFVTT